MGNVTVCQYFGPVPAGDCSTVNINLSVNVSSAVNNDNAPGVVPNGVVSGNVPSVPGI